VLATVIKQTETIASGWCNWLIKKPEIEVIASRREVICNRCEHRQANICGLCGCPLQAKIRSPQASCPDTRW
jgi:hypothetical protein